MAISDAPREGAATGRAHLLAAIDAGSTYMRVQVRDRPTDRFALQLLARKLARKQVEERPKSWPLVGLSIVCESANESKVFVFHYI